MTPRARSGRADDDGQLAWRRFSPRPLTDGERWMALELEALRERRYVPGAWAGFVRHSFARAAQTRKARPQLARQSRRWGLVGAAGWLVACAGVQRFGPDHVRLRLLPGLAWWFAVWQMLNWHLGEAEGGDGIPRRQLGRADAVTLARFWLVPVVSGAQWSARGLPLVTAVGGLTDAVDGWLARRDGRTRLGRDLDTFADFAFMSVAVRAGWRGGRITSTAAAGLAGRHALGVGIATGAVFGEARRPAIRARRWGGALRIGGLVAATAGARRLGNAMLIAGSLVPPRDTTPGRRSRNGSGRLS